MYIERYAEIAQMVERRTGEQNRTGRVGSTPTQAHVLFTSGLMLIRINVNISSILRFRDKKTACRNAKWFIKSIPNQIIECDRVYKHAVEELRVEFQ